MRIRLLQKPGNFAFQHRPTRHYVLKSGPEWYHPTLGDFAAGARATFLYGQLRVWVLNKNLSVRIREIFVSDYFSDEAEYLAALKTGFTVRRGAERVAKLLIGHELAEEVTN